MSEFLVLLPKRAAKMRKALDKANALMVAVYTALDVGAEAPAGKKRGPKPGGKKRGRPAKAVAVAAETPAAAEAPKKRGRPPKVKVAAAKPAEIII